MLMVKLTVFGVVIFGVPFLFLYIYRKRASRKVFLISIAYVSIAIITSLPVIFFAKMMSDVEEVFPSDCDASIQIVNRYQERFDTTYGALINEWLFGSLPDIFLLSTSSICNYKLGNYLATKAALEQLFEFSENELSKRINIGEYRELLTNTEKMLAKASQ